MKSITTRIVLVILLYLATLAVPIIQAGRDQIDLLPFALSIGTISVSFVAAFYLGDWSAKGFLTKPGSKLRKGDVVSLEKVVVYKATFEKKEKDTGSFYLNPEGLEHFEALEEGEPVAVYYYKGSLYSCDGKIAPKRKS